MAGTIGLTENQLTKMNDYEKRLFDSKVGEARPLTERMIEELEDLQIKHEAKELPKTMMSELREIWREESFHRNFIFTNKFVQKGIQQEEEAITVLQQYYKKVLGKPLIFAKNKIRFRNKFIQGEPDLRIGKTKPKGRWSKGADTKCSWSLKTFPFEEDELDEQYEYQNQGYMFLTGADQWETAHVLVNATEHQLFLEKQKFFYAYNCPSEGDVFYEDMIKSQRDCELMMIYDRERFEEFHPNHDWVIPKDEWFGEGYDIPLEYRVCIRHSFLDKETIKLIQERVKIGRSYMRSLNKTMRR